MDSLKEAFEKRIGKKDESSFIAVVDAFFEEAQQNSSFILPMHIVRQGDDGDGQYRPLLLSTSKDNYMLVIVSDPVFMHHFKDQSYAKMNASSILSMVRDNSSISGIIINPFSEFHCFLPREGTIAMARELGLLE